MNLKENYDIMMLILILVGGIPNLMSGWNKKYRIFAIIANIIALVLFICLYVIKKI